MMGCLGLVVYIYTHVFIYIHLYIYICTYIVNKKSNKKIIVEYTVSVF